MAEQETDKKTTGTNESHPHPSCAFRVIHVDGFELSVVMIMVVHEDHLLVVMMMHQDVMMVMAMQTTTI
jgi:hypothetical protein